MAGEDSTKYGHIAGQLRDAIRKGEYPPGSQLPTKAALMETYGVAVGTIDGALNVLRTEGIIYSQHGKGTFVCDPLPEEPTSEFAAIMQRLDEMEAQIRRQVERIDDLEQLRRLREQ